MENAQYDGQLIDNLTDLVERGMLDAAFDAHLKQIGWPENVDPELLFIGARIHLTDLRRGPRYTIASRWPVMDADDEEAWKLLRSLQECFLTGLTEVCANCGRMEGDHGNFNDACPKGVGKFQRVRTPDANLSRQEWQNREWGV